MAVLRQIRLAEAAAGDVRDRSTDVVRAAAPMVVAAAVLPPLIAAFRETRPRTTVRILDTGVEWLGDRVAMGEADLALGPDRAVGEAVSAEPLFPTPWVLWCSPAHPLAAKTVLAWRDLEGRGGLRRRARPRAQRGPHAGRAAGSRPADADGAGRQRVHRAWAWRRRTWR